MPKGAQCKVPVYRVQILFSFDIFARSFSKRSSLSYSKWLSKVSYFSHTQKDNQSGMMVLEGPTSIVIVKNSKQMV